MFYVGVNVASDSDTVLNVRPGQGQVRHSYTISALVSICPSVLGINDDLTAYYAGEGGLPFYGLQTDTRYPVTNKPSWLSPSSGLFYSFDSAGTAFWRDGMSGAVMSPVAPYASPTLADLQTAELAAGAWDGVKELPGAVWSGIKTIGEGYRGLGYLVTGNIDSYQSNSNLTVDGILKGVVDNSPIGILGAMADGRYDLAGSRTTGFAFGLGASYAMTYANRVPGLNYDVGAAGRRAMWSLGETAALRMEGWLSDQGLILYAVPTGTRSIAKFDFGSYLRKMAGPSPVGMFDPHAHHILFKEGNGVAQKALVQEGQALLRRYDIDPIYGLENLTWAPNRVSAQHDVVALRNVVDSLKQVEQFGGSRADIVTKLDELGQLVARRK